MHVIRWMCELSQCLYISVILSTKSVYFKYIDLYMIQCWNKSLYLWVSVFMSTQDRCGRGEHAWTGCVRVAHFRHRKRFAIKRCDLSIPHNGDSGTATLPLAGISAVHQSFHVTRRNHQSVFFLFFFFAALWFDLPRGFAFYVK